MIDWSMCNCLSWRPAAADAALADTETRIGAALPDDYKDFLRLTNGAEGFFPSGYYIDIWPAEDIPSRGGRYHVETNTEGLLLFASDGGGEAYGFDMRGAEWRVVRVPFVGLSWSSAVDVGPNFVSFISDLVRAK